MKSLLSILVKILNQFEAKNVPGGRKMQKSTLNSFLYILKKILRVETFEKGEGRKNLYKFV